MNLWSVLLIAVGLSMDAFAVALASGRSSSKSYISHAIRLSFAFGLAQMLMPVIGWLVGVHFKQYIQSLDHWIAFGLLSFIGIKMIRESFASGNCDKKPDPLTDQRLFFLAVATSIDALVVGVMFALLDLSILMPCLLIGIVTFFMTALGAMIGIFCCCVWGKRAERAGGGILIMIGIKILLEHLFY